MWSPAFIELNWTIEWIGPISGTRAVVCRIHIDNIIHIQNSCVEQSTYNYSLSVISCWGIFDISGSDKLIHHHAQLRYIEGIKNKRASKLPEN